MLPAFGAGSPLTIAKRALKKATSADKQVKKLKQQVAQLRARPGPAGATGPAGPTGAKGDTGAAGTGGAAGTDGEDGAAVRTRARLTSGDATVPPGGTIVAIPLSNATWTQRAGETDQFFVEVRGTEPPNCTPGTPGIQFIVKVDGAPVPGQPNSIANQQQFNINPGADPFVLTWNAGFLIEPPGNASGARTVTLEAQQGCAGAGESYTIQGVKINVVAGV